VWVFGRDQARRWARFGVIIVASVSVPQQLCAGAWLAEQGRGQIIFSSGLTDSTQRFDRKGKARPADRFVKQEGMTAVEYGLHEHLTLMGGLGTGRSVFLFADEPVAISAYTGTIGMRTKLWAGSGAILSTQATLTGRTERAAPSRLRLMEPRLEGDVRLLAGYGFAMGSMTGFGEVQTGYRWRSGGHADELRVDATLGIRPAPFLLLLVQSFNTLALARDRRFNLPAPHQHKLHISAVADVTERMSVQIGVFASIRGRESLKERGAMLAVWRKF
jgi:protein XagA